MSGRHVAIKEIDGGAVAVSCSITAAAPGDVALTGGESDGGHFVAAASGLETRVRRSTRTLIDGETMETPDNMHPPEAQC